MTQRSVSCAASVICVKNTRQLKLGSHYKSCLLIQIYAHKESHAHISMDKMHSPVYLNS